MGRATRPAVLTPDQIARIDAAIGEAESNTTAEIVPVIATRSGEYWHAPYQAGMWGMGIVLLITTLGWLLVEHTWPVLHIGWYAALSMGGFFVGALSARIEPIQRAFAGDDVMLAQCHGRARQFFAAQGVFGTKERTGVLLYVSLFERVVLVLGDTGITKKLDPGAYESVVGAVTTRMREGRVEDGMIDGLKHLGALLGDRFPKAQDDENEIPNRLLLVT